MTVAVFRSPILRWAAVPVMAMVLPLVTTAAPASASSYVPIDGSGSSWASLAIGTSGNQFKNAPVIGPLMLALIKNWLDGGDHDTSPVQWVAPHTGSILNLAHYSRLRTPNEGSSYSVLG